MRIGVLVGIVVAVVVVIAFLLYFIFYLSFQYPRIVSMKFTLSGVSLSGASFDMYVGLENPNPYTVSIIGFTISVEYSDGVSATFNPAYLPIELSSYGYNETVLTTFISYSDYMQMVMNPPTSSVITMTMTVKTPIGIRTITCEQTVYTSASQTTPMTCTTR
ncbi:MAG: hypothetical protein QXP98_02950 [Thermoproteus sp.]